MASRSFLGVIAEKRIANETFVNISEEKLNISINSFNKTDAFRNEKERKIILISRKNRQKQKRNKIRNAD